MNGIIHTETTFPQNFHEGIDFPDMADTQKKQASSLTSMLLRSCDDVFPTWDGSRKFHDCRTYGVAR